MMFVEQCEAAFTPAASGIKPNLQSGISGIEPAPQISRASIRSAATRGLVRHRLGRGGFTLIELLVVVGIIAVTAGVFGVALRGGSPSVALQSAQGTMASLLNAARSEAALKNASAALVVLADTEDPDRYLRAVAIADLSAGVWVRTGDYVLLPVGVYVVPPTSSSPLPSSALTAVTLEGKPHLGLAYSSLGTPDYAAFSNTSSIHQIILSSARRSDTANIVFDNAQNVRGLALSAYGAVTFINDASGFAQ